MICSRCHCENPDNSKFCKSCGHLLGAQQQSPQIPIEQPAPAAQPQPTQATGAYKPYTPVARKPYEWMDVCGIIGFVMSLVAVFGYWAIMCPLALVGSIIGLKGNHTKGLSVAGIIIAVVGAVLKVFWVLNEYHLLPFWFSAGILG